MLNKQIINNLRYRCMQHENTVTNPQARKFWSRHFDRLTALARKVGWID